MKKPSNEQRSPLLFLRQQLKSHDVDESPPLESCRPGFDRRRSEGAGRAPSGAAKDRVGGRAVDEGARSDGGGATPSARPAPGRAILHPAPLEGDRAAALTRPRLPRDDVAVVPGRARRHLDGALDLLREDSHRAGAVHPLERPTQRRRRRPRCLFVGGHGWVDSCRTPRLAALTGLAHHASSLRLDFVHDVHRLRLPEPGVVRRVGVVGDEWSVAVLTIRREVAEHQGLRPGHR